MNAAMLCMQLEKAAQEMHVQDAGQCSHVSSTLPPHCFLCGSGASTQGTQLTHDAAGRHLGERILALTITIDCIGNQVPGKRWPPQRQLSWPVQPVQLCQCKARQDVAVSVGTNTAAWWEQSSRTCNDTHTVGAFCASCIAILSAQRRVERHLV